MVQKISFSGIFVSGNRKTYSAFYDRYKKINGFYKFLRENKSPTLIMGDALQELKFLLTTGEALGVSVIQFLPDQKIKAISGPFVGYEGKIVAVNLKKKRITVRSSLIENSTTFDLKFEEAEIN